MITNIIKYIFVCLMSIRRMSFVSYVLCIILCGLQYSFWFGKYGVRDFIRIFEEIRLCKHSININSMRIRNAQLSSEIHDLLCGYESIEEHARYDLDMIKLDEVYYKVE